MQLERKDSVDWKMMPVLNLRKQIAYGRTAHHSCLYLPCIRFLMGYFGGASILFLFILFTFFALTMIQLGTDQKCASKCYRNQKKLRPWPVYFTICEINMSIWVQSNYILTPEVKCVQIVNVSQSTGIRTVVVYLLVFMVSRSTSTVTKQKAMRNSLPVFTPLKFFTTGESMQSIFLGDPVMFNSF